MGCKAHRQSYKVNQYQTVCLLRSYSKLAVKLNECDQFSLTIIFAKFGFINNKICKVNNLHHIFFRVSIYDIYNKKNA